MRSIVCFGLAVSAVLVGACATPSPDGPTSDEFDLTSKGLPLACSKPVRSADGKYVAVDVCPANGSDGRLVRVDLSTGAETTIATYGPKDRIGHVTAQASRLAFDIMRDVAWPNVAEGGVEIQVHDWALTSHRTIAPTPIVGVAGDFHGLGLLELTDDGNGILYAAFAFPTTPPHPDTELSRRLFVAPTTGNAPPVALALGDAAHTWGMRFSKKGGTVVGHTIDGSRSAGEDVYVIETGGPSTATLAAKRHIDVSSPFMDKSNRWRQNPWDGSRIWGEKIGKDRIHALATVDPRTGVETELDTGRDLRVLGGVGADIVYEVKAITPAGFEVTLRKIAVAGGPKTDLLKVTQTHEAFANHGISPIALPKSGAYAILQSADPSQPAPDALGPGKVFERWLVRLDGTMAPVKLPGLHRQMFEAPIPDQAGDRVLLTDESGPLPMMQLVDLVTGSVTSSTLAPNTRERLVGDGSRIVVERCAVAPETSLHHVTALGTTMTPCEDNSFARADLGDEWFSTPGSPALVLARLATVGGTRHERRWNVGIARP